MFFTTEPYGALSRLERGTKASCDDLSDPETIPKIVPAGAYLEGPSQQSRGIRSQIFYLTCPSPPSTQIVRS